MQLLAITKCQYINILKSGSVICRKKSITCLLICKTKTVQSISAFQSNTSSSHFTPVDSVAWEYFNASVNLCCAEKFVYNLTKNTYSQRIKVAKPSNSTVSIIVYNFCVNMFSFSYAPTSQI